MFFADRKLIKIEENKSQRRKMKSKTSDFSSSLNCRSIFEACLKTQHKISFICLETRMKNARFYYVRNKLPLTLMSPFCEKKALTMREIWHQSVKSRTSGGQSQNGGTKLRPNKLIVKARTAKMATTKHKNKFAIIHFDSSSRKSLALSAQCQWGGGKENLHFHFLLII